jgi:hypothetical protein
MRTFADLTAAVGAIAAFANLCLIVVFSLAIRRWQRLNAALLLTATMAWTMRGWTLSFVPEGMRLKRETWVGAMHDREGHPL